MNNRRTILAALIPPMLTATAAVLLAMRINCGQSYFRMSLYDLFGRNAALLSDELKSESVDTIIVVASAPTAAEARKKADGFIAAVSCFDGIDTSTDANLKTFAAALPDLVAASDLKLLSSESGRAKIARNAVRRYYSSPVPPMFSPAEDPFCLKENFILSLGASTNQFASLHLDKNISDDTDALIRLKRRLEEVKSRFPGVRLSGAPIHTATAAERCKCEISVLSAFSLLLIALLSIFAFRSIRWLPLLTGSLVTSAAAGAVFLFALFDSVHVLTMVMGTTVMGLVIDYSFHWLMAKDKRLTTKDLLISFTTTEIALLPLIFSSLPVLCESATFLAAALAAALVYVVIAYPK